MAEVLCPRRAPSRSLAGQAEQQPCERRLARARLADEPDVSPAGDCPARRRRQHGRRTVRELPELGSPAGRPRPGRAARPPYSATGPAAARLSEWHSATSVAQSARDRRRLGPRATRPHRGSADGRSTRPAIACGNGAGRRSRASGLVHVTPNRADRVRARRRCTGAQAPAKSRRAGLPSTIRPAYITLTCRRTTCDPEVVGHDHDAMPRCSTRLQRAGR